MPVTNIKGDWSSGNLIIVRVDTGATVATITPTGITLASGAIFELNTGADLTVNGNSLIDEVAALTGLDSGELQVLNAVTPGTVTLSKAVVVDANKDIGDFRNLDAVNIDAGASGTAGSVDIFPATASKGKLTLSCTNQTGDTAVTINANAMGQATQVNIADPGAAASYVVQSTAAVTLAEADVLDGATAGQGVASKAVVLDASGNVAMPATGILGLSRAALAATGTGVDATDAAVIATQVVAVTASDGTKGVALPAAATTTGPIFIINTVTTATLKVWPVAAGDDAINALGANTAFVVGAGKSAVFIPTSATQWYCEDMAAVTSTTTELNYVDITTLGTAQASKAVTADANIDVTSLRNVTLTGAIDAQTIKADAVTLSPLKWVDVTVTAALLDAGGNVPVIAGVAGDQYKIRDVVLVGGGTNYGAGGDRLISLTDGTTVWTTIANADIETAPAASLRWGDTKVPFLTGTSDTASVAAAAIRFQYSGGTTDHGGTGSIKFSVCLEKVA